MERRRGFVFADEIRVLAPLLGCWAVALALLLMIASTGEAQQRLLVEPLAISAGLPWYAGLVGYASLCAWGVAVTAAFGGSFVAHLAGRDRASSFLRQSGLLTALLMLNEIFGLHYSVATAVGIKKSVAVLGLACVCVLWAVSNHREILRTRKTVLGLSVVVIVISLALDRRASLDVDTVLLEEGFQLLGVIGWATYFVLTAGDVARSVIEPQSERLDVSSSPDTSADRPLVGR
ncbi:MAG: hypothetical protein IH940_08245 [Acidobacteria bacterium]|nr:hypothetical protein [Acidobacteriota bacterium]